MRCPYCNADDTKVIDSRAFLDGYSIKRRRECVSCGKRFTTYEKVDEDTTIYVVKKDKRRDKFDSKKLLRGLMTATVKRNISKERLELFVSEIEKSIQNSLKTEISTKELGEMVLEKLKSVDQVAYVRFASVYKEFDDIKSFLEVVENMEQNKSEENKSEEK
ncbi:transcriptional regulator NrdR [Fusobacterium sp. PH5-44]|uniref:transcriptional regulator NrdR n=1 Tax=unclassified Fusobacterium TaxID=2648384 RepID=UPI003D1CD831